MGQGPIALTEDAGGVCLGILSFVNLLSFLSPSLEDGPVD